MFKITIFAVCIVAAMASALHPDKNGSFKIADTEEKTELTDLEWTPENRTFDSLGDLGAIITLVKDQFQSIIEDCIAHIVQHVTNVLHKVKENVLKSLANFTLADVARSVIDGASGVLGDVDEDIVDVARPANHFGPSAVTYGAYPYVFRAQRHAEDKSL